MNSRTTTTEENTTTNKFLNKPNKSKRNFYGAAYGSKNRYAVDAAVGPILLLFLVAIYLFGFIRSILSLPDVHLGSEGDFSGMKKMNGMNLKTVVAPFMWPLKESSKTSKVNGMIIPESNWPVSIRYEDDNFEDIIHPGDKETVISVPKFWSAPLMNGELMSVELATRIGTYIGGKTDSDPKSKGPLDERTIFIAIASYRDWQCRYTVESIFKRAKFPNRVRVAVVDQIDESDPSCGSPIDPCVNDPNQAICKYSNQIDVLELEGRLALGPVFARHLGHRMYRGEYYYMQIDAHVTFVQDWDIDIINQMESTKNDMAVLSTYLTDIVGSIDEKTGKSLRNTRPIMCNTDFEGGGNQRHLRHLSQPERIAPVKDSPQLQPYWAAGWSFSRGHFVVNIPYDMYGAMVFMGEEMSVGIRGFTYGYDHYAPQKSICFHTYANGKNSAKRNKVPKYWENESLYPGLAAKGMRRLLGIIGMNPETPLSDWDHDDEKLYGVGKGRNVTKFYETFGIDIYKKKVQKNLCMFVQSGKMHRNFLKFLRSNGMGIDYSKINYKFVTSDFKANNY